MKHFERHIELVEAVNNATTQQEHDLAEARLRGFRDACECFLPSGGTMLMDADMHYIDQGVTRDMCCGVFLDWKPA